MPARISHSLLDPLIMPFVPGLYRSLRIPHRLPPEGIILIGHLLAVAGAVGLAFSTELWWAGLIAAAGILGNHLADMVDGTHARSTGQCRNGGELLDHFTDPLSFSYWMIGLGLSVAVSTGRVYLGLGLGIACVLCIYATAVLTNIKAKITGRFTLARFGPTEFKVLLAMYGVAMSIVGLSGGSGPDLATVFLCALSSVGVIQLAVNLVQSVREVNGADAAPDDTQWVLRGCESGL